MTRINLVPPSILTNKHLMAEYRELPRIFTAVRKLMDKCEPRRGDAWTKLMVSKEITNEYVLGKGHVKFFYNKIPYLLERYKNICSELRFVRKFNIDRSMIEDILHNGEECVIMARVDMLHDWEPSPEEIYLNMARLCKRSNLELILIELSNEQNLEIP